MTELGLEGGVALVTGAAHGIGAAVVRGFLAAGARVAAVDQNSEALSHTDALLLKADVTHQEEVSRAVGATVQEFGRIDHLVTCAGIVADAVHWKLDDAAWCRVLDVNLTGSFRFVREVVPVMRSQGGGAIVLVSSINGLRGKFGQANYAASKAGVIGLARSAALEVGRFGIRVNVVAPGFIETAMTAGLPGESRERALAATPLARVGLPADVADPILFLCSPLARHVTGAVLRVDGGQLLGG